MDGFKSGGGGFNVGFYGSIFFYCFDSAMILNDGRKMVLVWIWDEGEGEWTGGASSEAWNRV